MAMVESQFSNLRAVKKKRSRRQRKNYDVIVLPDRMAKGRYPKGQGFNKAPRATRKPVMGDRLIHADDALWLRA